MYDLSWPGWVCKLDLSYRNHFTSNQWFLMKNKAVQTIAWKWLLRVRVSVISLSPLQKMKRDPRSGIKRAKNYWTFSLSLSRQGWEHHEKPKEAWDPHTPPHTLIQPMLSDLKTTHDYRCSFGPQSGSRANSSVMAVLMHDHWMYHRWVLLRSLGNTYKCKLKMWIQRMFLNT